MDDPSKTAWDPADRIIPPAIVNGSSDERTLLLDGIDEHLISGPHDPKGTVLLADGQSQQGGAHRCFDGYQANSSHALHVYPTDKIQ